MLASIPNRPTHSPPNPCKLPIPPSASEEGGESCFEDAKGLKTSSRSLSKIESVTEKASKNPNSQIVGREADLKEVGDEKRLRTGRWSKQECRLFEEALKKFGKHWKKVEAYIGTRSGTQVRSHAQKYFLKSKGETLSEPHDSSIAPTTSAGPTHEKPETDMRAGEREEVSGKEKAASFGLSVLQESVPQSSFTIVTKDTIPPTNIVEPVLVECKYLMNYMRQFGFNTMEEIYARYYKLSDWVESISALRERRNKEVDVFNL
eukprot:TRINITY_DN2177_c0_g4_i3.p1 TRINITY_DN2177_c0_g4~~TRINITY_DN2177_c0_g4_i3.p1  ORF type:complete len:262 (-),score=45.79 TRINITY_DN2177_c0_g4_i3:169-954(-)